VQLLVGVAGRYFYLNPMLSPEDVEMLKFLRILERLGVKIRRCGGLRS